MNVSALLPNLQRLRLECIVPAADAITQAETLANWLKERPGVQIVTRDRSLEYARGIREGALEAVQVTDRFHLLSNLRAMLERVIERNRHRLQGIALPTVSPEVGEPSPEKEAVSRSRQPAKRSPTENATRHARYQRRLALRQQVHSLSEQWTCRGAGEPTQGHQATDVRSRKLRPAARPRTEGWRCNR